MTEFIGWHFVKPDHLTGERNILVWPGQKLHVDPPIQLCKNGLHASRRALDALQYAPGPIACRVRLRGEVCEGKDKAVATDRECLWMANATRVLHEFAYWCAEQALMREREAGREPDPRSWAAIDAKRKWLKGEIDDCQLAAARVAARAAADAAWATWAALAAARAAAKAIAWDVARDVARDAAWATERDTQNAKLEQMLMALHEEESDND